MANFSTFHQTPVARDTNISSQVIAAGNLFLGAEILGSTYLDESGIISLTFASGVAPISGESVEVFILYSGETGYVSGSPIIEPVKIINLPVDTAQYTVDITISLNPKDYKLLVKSKSDQAITVTATMVTFGPHAKQDA